MAVVIAGSARVHAKWPLVTDPLAAPRFVGRTTGENIHWGVGSRATPARIVDDWMDSPGHRANILRASFTRVGTGIGNDAPEPRTEGPAGVYVQNFGG